MKPGATIALHLLGFTFAIFEPNGFPSFIPASCAAVDKQFLAIARARHLIALFFSVHCVAGYLAPRYCYIPRAFTLLVGFS